MATTALQKVYLLTTSHISGWYRDVVILGLAYKRSYRFPHDKYSYGSNRVNTDERLSSKIDDRFRNFVFLCTCLKFVETESFLPCFCELFEPDVLFGDESEEVFLLLLAHSLLFVLEEVDTFIVHLFVFLTDLLLTVDQSPLFLLGQLSQQTRSPIDVKDVLLESVLSDDFTNEVPHLVAFLSA